jgi:hypothetical protein
MTIADACKVFITNRESAALARDTAHQSFTKQLAAYADSSGYVMARSDHGG